MNNSTNNTNGTANTSTLTKALIEAWGGQMHIELGHGFRLSVFNQEQFVEPSDFNIILHAPEAEDVQILIKDRDNLHYTAIINPHGDAFPDTSNMCEVDAIITTTQHINWFNNCMEVEKILDETAANMSYLDPFIEDEDKKNAMFDERIWRFQKKGHECISLLITRLCEEIYQDSGKCKRFSTQEAFPREY